MQVQLTINWEEIKRKSINIASKSNERENLNRIPHEYKVGEKVLIMHLRSDCLRKKNLPVQGFGSMRHRKKYSDKLTLDDLI